MYMYVAYEWDPLHYTANYGYVHITLTVYIAGDSLIVRLLPLILGVRDGLI